MAAVLRSEYVIKTKLFAVTEAKEKTKLLLMHDHLAFVIMYFCILIVCSLALHETYYKFKKDNPVFLLSLGYHKITPPYYIRFGECLWVVSMLGAIALIPVIILLDLIYRIFPIPNHQPLSQLMLLMIANTPCGVTVFALWSNRKFIQLYKEKTTKSDKKTLLSILIIYWALYLYIMFLVNNPLLKQ